MDLPLKKELLLNALHWVGFFFRYSLGMLGYKCVTVLGVAKCWDNFGENVSFMVQNLQLCNYNINYIATSSLKCALVVLISYLSQCPGSVSLTLLFSAFFLCF